MLDDENYVEPNDVMDEGGIVKKADGGESGGSIKTRKPRGPRAKAVKNEAAGSTGDNQQAGSGIYLLVEKDLGVVERATSQEEAELAACKAISEPDKYKMYRAHDMDPRDVFRSR